MRRIRRRTPWPIATLALIGLAFFVVPLAGLLAQAPWSRLVEVASSGLVLDALGLSLLTSALATVAGAIVGIPLAWFLARSEQRGLGIVRAIVTLPLVLPPVVGGAALLFALGRRGSLGGPLAEATGFVLPFSIWGVVVANAFVAMPFLIITVEGAIRALDQRYEHAAATLGAGRWTTMRRVTLPMVAPGIMSGLVLSWARAFGEFGATITFAGNLGGRTQTLPLAVFVALESDREAAIVISLLMVAVSITVLVLLRDRWWRVT